MDVYVLCIFIPEKHLTGNLVYNHYELICKNNIHLS